MLSHPARLYRTLAAAEMVTWALLLAGMAGKYLLGLGDLGVRLGGGIHGFVFLGYTLVTVLVAIDRRWPVRELALGLGSAILPFLTVPFERHAERAGLLANRSRPRHSPSSGSRPSSAGCSGSARRGSGWPELSCRADVRPGRC